MIEDFEDDSQVFENQMLDNASNRELKAKIERMKKQINDYKHSDDTKGPSNYESINSQDTRYLQRDDQGKAQQYYYNQNAYDPSNKFA